MVALARAAEGTALRVHLSDFDRRRLELLPGEWRQCNALAVAAWTTEAQPPSDVATALALAGELHRLEASGLCEIEFEAGVYYTRRSELGEQLLELVGAA
jgi:hypothetical protein